MWMMFSGFSCDRPAETNLPEPAADQQQPAEPSQASAVFAGGCFWCVEAVFEQLRGVSEVISGYAGGTAEHADYRAVCSGATDHAEVVKIVYDPSQITYGQLLKVFFATHNPTQLNAQGPDTGRQYRSAVFYADEEQKQLAEAYIKQLEAAGTYDQPIVTTLEPLEKFYPAEDYHQNYVQYNPAQRYIVNNALPKVKKVRDKFGDLIKDDARK